MAKKAAAKKGKKSASKEVTSIKELIELDARLAELNAQLIEKQIGKKPSKYNLYSLVLKYGRRFTPAPKPKEVSWGKKGNCYENAAIIMDDDGKRLIYCEGWATLREEPGLLIAHAWCVDSAGKVIDNTWREPGAEYYGIPFTPKFYHRVAVERNYTSLMTGNGALLNGIPKGAIAKI